MNNILRQPYQNTEYADFAVYANETQRRVEDFNGDKYALLATEILVDGIITDISQTPEYLAEELAKAKEAKLQENATKRDEFLIAGVVYKNVLFDSDTDSKANLLFAATGMDETQTVIWLGKDNQPLECTKQDIFNIGSAIGAMTVNVWAVKNPYYLQAIAEAKTIEELNLIVIDYNSEE